MQVKGWKSTFEVGIVVCLIINLFCSSVVKVVNLVYCFYHGSISDHVVVCWHTSDDFC